MPAVAMETKVACEEDVEAHDVVQHLLVEARELESAPKELWSMRRLAPLLLAATAATLIIAALALSGPPPRVDVGSRTPQDVLELDSAPKLSKHAGCKVARAQLGDSLKVPGSEDHKSKEPVQKKLWGQCGGANYDGPTKCDRGMACVAKKIKGDPKYKQCKQDLNMGCISAEGNKDMKCYYKVTWDMTKGIVSQPANYHGLTAQSSWDEFQEQNHNYMAKKSGCPAPCGPGTCYEVLHIEGCDSYNEWTCDTPHHSLAYDCCCRKYHPNVTKKAILQLKHEEQQEVKGPSLFCMALVMPHTYEMNLMRMQFEQGLGIFDPNCDEWAIYSNETISMNCKSDDKDFDSTMVKGDLAAEKGGDYGTAMNTKVFLNLWNRVIDDPRPWSHDWVVKVDPDCLFMPGRLKELMISKGGPFSGEEPAGGMYINNCYLGMHGPIEVFSKKALGNYKNGVKKCMKGEPGKHGQEDWFLRSCFKEIGVEKVDAYNILFEGENACKERPSAIDPDRPPCFAPEAAFHPFKTEESMLHCWAEAISHHVANPLVPVTDAPSAANNRHG